jgi:hypothetical protein
MRLELALALTVMAAGTAAAQVTNLEAPGNLAPSADPGCVTMAEADALLSPPDLALGVLACGRAANWDAAAELYTLMLLRAAFDTKRVADASAHQAGDVLSMQLADSLTEADRTSLGAALDRFVDPAAAQRAVFCQAAMTSAVPQHDPSWMVQHGMGAFLKPAGDGLIEGFDPQQAWTALLRDDLKCA